MLRFVRKMKIFCSDDLFWLKVIEAGYSSWKRQTTFIKLYDRHTYLVHKCDTSVTYVEGFVTYGWFTFI